MKKRPNEKMSVSNRAKQFVPFSALEGLDEALARIEREIELDNETEFIIKHIAVSSEVPSEVSSEASPAVSPAILPDSVVSAQSKESKEV